MTTGFRTKLNGVTHYDSRITELARYIATVTVGVQDGSYTNAELLTGSVDWQLTPENSSPPQLPAITVNGSTISWAWGISHDRLPRTPCYLSVWVV